MLLNLEVGVRIVAKARDNWKHHEIYEKDAISLYQPKQELTKLHWIFPSEMAVKHVNWRNAMSEQFFLPLWAPSTHVQAMCDTDMLMPHMCLWSWTEPLTWQAGEHLNQADIGPDHNIWVLWVLAEQTILFTLALMVSLKSGKLQRK